MKKVSEDNQFKELEVDTPKMSSPRSFGVVFFIFFLLLSLYPLIKGQSINVVLLIIAIVFLASGLFFPTLLKPLNLLWFKFGMVLHAVMNPLILGLIFFVVMLPISLLMRLTGHDPLQLKLNKKDNRSYWITRTPPGPEAESMKNQF